MSKDYSNTSVYKICCKDTAIEDVYVGHTICFDRRKEEHQRACKGKTTNYKLYQFIRENGGWNNWEMIELAKYNCKDAREARMKEQQHYEELNAGLNSVPPLSKMVAFNEKQILDNTRETKCIASEKFYCDSCGYSSSRKSQFDRHVISSKHKRKTKEVFFEEDDMTLKKYKCDCDMIFKSRSTFWRHRKVCNGKVVSDNIGVDEDVKVEAACKQIVVSEEILLLLIKQNSELLDILKNGVAIKNPTNIVT